MVAINCTSVKQLTLTLPYSNICSDTALSEKANIQLFCQLLFKIHLLNWQDAWIQDSKEQASSNLNLVSTEPFLFPNKQQVSLGWKVEGIFYVILYIMSYTIPGRTSSFFQK